MAASQTQTDIVIDLNTKYVGFLLKNFLRTQTTDSDAVFTNEPTLDPPVVYSRILYSDEIYTNSINANPEDYGLPPTSHKTMQVDQDEETIKNGYQIKLEESDGYTYWTKWEDGMLVDVVKINEDDEKFNTGGVAINQVVKDIIMAVMDGKAEGAIIDLSLVLAKVYFLRLHFSSSNEDTSPSFYHPLLADGLPSPYKGDTLMKAFFCASSPVDDIDKFLVPNDLKKTSNLLGKSYSIYNNESGVISFFDVPNVFIVDGKFAMSDNNRQKKLLCTFYKYVGAKGSASGEGVEGVASIDDLSDAILTTKNEIAKNDAIAEMRDELVGNDFSVTGVTGDFEVSGNITLGTQDSNNITHVNGSLLIDMNRDIDDFDNHPQFRIHAADGEVVGSNWTKARVTLDKGPNTQHAMLDIGNAASQWNYLNQFAYGKAQTMINGVRTFSVSANTTEVMNDLTVEGGLTVTGNTTFTNIPSLDPSATQENLNFTAMNSSDYHFLTRGWFYATVGIDYERIAGSLVDVWGIASSTRVDALEASFLERIVALEQKCEELESKPAPTFCVWAEEKSDISLLQGGIGLSEFSYGDGESGYPYARGLAMGVSCKLIALSIDVGTTVAVTGVSSVVVMKDGSSSGDVVSTTSANYNTKCQTFSSGVAFSPGQVLSFKTLMGHGTSNRAVVTAWFERTS